jgi:hypothetical protein
VSGTLHDVVADAAVAAPAEVTWRVVTDWSGQGAWMPATTVRVTGGDGTGVGSELEAVTGYGRASFVDTMRIVEWHPPHRCVVVHTGTVVRGAGIFEVVALPDGSSRIVWTERVELPFGAFGRAVWPVVRPLVQAGLTVALRRLARLAARAR